MEVSGSMRDARESRPTFAGFTCKKRKVRQAKASTREAMQAMRSARVRPEETVSFVGVVDISLGKLSKHPTSEPQDSGNQDLSAIFVSTASHMPSLSPDPGFEYCRNRK